MNDRIDWGVMNLLGPTPRPAKEPAKPSLSWPQAFQNAVVTIVFFAFAATMIIWFTR